MVRAHLRKLGKAPNWESGAGMDPNHEAFGFRAQPNPEP